MCSNDFTTVGPDGYLHTDRALLRSFSGSRAQALRALARWCLSSRAARSVGVRWRGCLSLVAALALAVLSACSCPTNESGIAVSPTKYLTEVAYACAVVDGCERTFSDGLRTYEVPRESMAEYCDGQDVLGCYCDAPNCQAIFVFECPPYDVDCERLQRKVMLHEMLHAAFASVGVDTADHGPKFKAAFSEAWLDMSKL